MENANISAEKLLTWKRKLGALKSDCGCRVGEMVLIPSMAVYAYYYPWAHAADYTVRHKVVAGVIVFFASAVVGKSLGLLVSRLRYNALYRKYMAALAAAPGTDQPAHSQVT